MSRFGQTNKVSLDISINTTSLNNLNNLNNLSIYKIASINNEISSKEIYKLDSLLQIEYLIKDILSKKILSKKILSKKN